MAATNTDQPTVPTLNDIGRSGSDYLDEKKSIDDIADAKEYDVGSNSFDGEEALEIKGAQLVL